MVLKGLLLVWDIHEESQLGKEDLPRWGCLIAKVMLSPEYLGIHQFSYRHF